jgi:hypothetical protein
VASVLSSPAPPAGESQCGPRSRHRRQDGQRLRPYRRCSGRRGKTGHRCRSRRQSRPYGHTPWRVHQESRPNASRRSAAAWCDVSATPTGANGELLDGMYPSARALSAAASGPRSHAPTRRQRAPSTPCTECPPRQPLAGGHARPTSGPSAGERRYASPRSLSINSAAVPGGSRMSGQSSNGSPASTGG